MRQFSECSRTFERRPAGAARGVALRLRAAQRQVTLGDDTGVCRGTAFNAPWLVYHPAPGYVGTDNVSISWKWTQYDNGTIMKYATRDFTINVK